MWQKRDADVSPKVQLQPTGENTSLELQHPLQRKKNSGILHFGNLRFRKIRKTKIPKDPKKKNGKLEKFGRFRKIRKTKIPKDPKIRKIRKTKNSEKRGRQAHNEKRAKGFFNETHFKQEN